MESQGSVFEGVKIADFSWNVACPLVIRYLANYGATVVHVESKTAIDTSRTMPPYRDGVPRVNNSPFWNDLNSDKYGMALNLNRPQGREVARRLVEWADVVAESYTPGKFAEWGLAYEDLRKIKPDIVMLSATMEGQTGPFATEPGIGNMLQAMAGITSLLGYPGEEPQQPYGAYTDWFACHFIAGIVACSLDYRKRTGKGLYIDVSQYELSLQLLSPLFLDYFANNRVAERGGNRSSYACPHGVYRCRGEDRWCAITVFDDKDWKNFRDALGNPEWAMGFRFSTLLGRKQHEEELDKLICEWTSGFTAEEVMSRMQGQCVPAGIVASSKDLFEDEQLAYRRAFRYLEHPEMGNHLYTEPAFTLSKTPANLRLPAPCLGQHTEFVCTSLLGMQDSKFIELLQEGVFE